MDGGREGNIRYEEKTICKEQKHDNTVKQRGITKREGIKTHGEAEKIKIYMTALVGRKQQKGKELQGHRKNINPGKEIHNSAWYG